MLSPPWIALNRGAKVEPLLGHQNPHPSRKAGSFSSQLRPSALPYPEGNMHFTLKQKLIQRSDFNEFVGLYKPGRIHQRQPTWSEANPEGRWRATTMRTC